MPLLAPLLKSFTANNYYVLLEKKNKNPAWIGKSKQNIMKWILILNPNVSTCYSVSQMQPLQQGGAQISDFSCLCKSGLNA